ncbi:MAG: DUF1553 domain-containing protein [Zavarzinella sp.]
MRLFTTLCCMWSFCLGATSAELLSPNSTVEQAIDHYINLQLKEAAIVPAPLVDDAEYLRRVTLDLAGRIPTIVEYEEYLKANDRNKKQQLVERLIASPSFVRHQSVMFDAMMTNTSSTKNSLQKYFAVSLEKRKSWDLIFRELMLPDESDANQPGSGDYLRARIGDLDRLTNDVSVTFFGVNVSCAQCHDHPLVEDWKQEHFYGMKTFFSRTFLNGKDVSERDYGLVKYTPNKGKPTDARPLFLSGKVIPLPNLQDPTKEQVAKEKELLEKHKQSKTPLPKPSVSARETLVVTALKDVENDFFAKSIVNRIWHRFFDYGIVNPLDQMHSENSPSHPEMLAWLARDFRNHQFDLHRIMRGIVLSDTYARSSKWENENVPQKKYFAVSNLKPLMPTQLALSMRIASQDPTYFRNAGTAEQENNIEKLVGSANSFANLLEIPGENFQVGVTEALLFSNSDQINRLLFQSGNSLIKPLVALPLNERVSEMYRFVFARTPTAIEMNLIQEYLKQRNDRAEEALQQVIWALVSSPEFRFNH